MQCNRCKNEIDDPVEFKGKVLPFIADGQREFICEYCVNNQPERSKREDLSKIDVDLSEYITGKIDWKELKMRCSEQ